MPDPARWLSIELLYLILDRGEIADLVGTSQLSREWRFATASHPRFFLPVVIRLNIMDPLDLVAYTTAVRCMTDCTQQGFPLGLTLQFISPIDDSPADTFYDPSSEIWTEIASRLSDALPLLRRLTLDINCSALSKLLIGALCTQPAPLLEEVALRGAETHVLTHRLSVPTELFARTAPRLRYFGTDRAITLPDGPTTIPALQSIRHMAVFGPAGNLALNALTPQLRVLEVRILPWSRLKTIVHAPHTLSELLIGDEEHSIDEAAVSKVFADCNIASLRTLHVEFTHIKDWGASQFSPTPYLAGLPEFFDMTVRRVPPVLTSNFQAAREYKNSDPNLRWSPFEICLTNDNCSIKRVFTTTSESDVSAFALDNTIQRVRRLEVRYLNLVALLKLALTLPVLEELRISLSTEWEWNLPEYSRSRERCRPDEASQQDIVRCPSLTKLHINLPIIKEPIYEDREPCDWQTFSAFLAGELGFGMMKKALRPHLVLIGFKDKKHEEEFGPHMFATVSYA